MHFRTVVSLFDGMECGRIALDKNGDTYGHYYASEIDKFAVAESSANYPDTIHVGDVTKWREWDIDWTQVDLVIGGSPCQGFSFAGKQLVFDDPRSKLFFEFVKIVNAAKFFNPNVKFLLENVKMKKDHLEVITDYMGVEPVFINSALVCAQNRRRYYWCNWPVRQPEDRGIMLVDILQTDGEHSTLMSPKFVERQKGNSCLVSSAKDKAVSLCAMEYVKNGRQGDYIACDSDGAQVIDRMVGRRINPVTGKRDDYNSEVPIQQRIEVVPGGKSGCLTTVQKDNIVVRDRKPLTFNEWGMKFHSDEFDGASIGEIDVLQDKYMMGCGDTYKECENHSYEYDLYLYDFLYGEKPRGNNPGGLRGLDGKSPAMTSNAWQENVKVVVRDKSKTVRTSGRGSYERHEWDSIDDTHYRKLTVVECCRLQGVPDDYFKVSSNTQCYKMLGNGWQVDTIVHLLQELNNENE